MAHDNGLVKGLVIGFFAGGVIGAAIALMYAPKSGRELRADLREKSDDLIEGAEEYLHAAAERAGQIVSEAKKRSDHLITQAKKRADTLLGEAEKVITDAKQKTSVVVEEGARLKDAVKAGVDSFKEERRRS